MRYLPTIPKLPPFAEDLFTLELTGAELAQLYALSRKMEAPAPPTGGDHFPLEPHRLHDLLTAALPATVLESVKNHAIAHHGIRPDNPAVLHPIQP